MDIKEHKQKYATRADRSDDPYVPHGTRRGYRVWLCSCTLCRKANNHRQRIHRKNVAMRRVTMIPKYRLVRRMEAIHFMGYTTIEIAVIAEMDRRCLAKLWTTKTELSRFDLFLRVDKAYRKLAFKPIKNPNQEQIKWQKKALERNYASALMWNNIDDPNERPRKRWHGNGG